jgi:hypothetical protein
VIEEQLASLRKLIAHFNILTAKSFWIDIVEGYALPDLRFAL